MARATGVDGLAEAIDKILEEYGDEIAEKNVEVVKKVGRQAAKALRQEAGSKFKGNKYANGWSVTFEGDSLTQTAIVYNKRLPGLPHLLENGHAKRGGGRTSGIVHIKPVEDQTIRLFEDALKREIQ